MTTSTKVIPYYSEGVMIALPYAGSSLALKYIHNKNPQIVVLKGRLMTLRPYVREWIKKGIPDPPAQLIYSKGSSIEDRIAIFKFHRVSTSK